MKWITAFIAILTLTAGCKKEEKIIAPKIPVAATAAASQECYTGVSGNDTVSLQLQLKGNEVTSGRLRYHFSEKDSSQGELVGLLKGDTLSATYTFNSEGKTSVREVAFLKKGNAYVEGYGETTDDGRGNVSFKDLRKLKFEGIALERADCH